MTDQNRRDFLATSAVAVASIGAAVGSTSCASGPARRTLRSAEGDDHRGPCCISSGNGLPATARAMDLIAQGWDPLDAIVAGVAIVEDDPNDNSVGFGGLPNEDGVVELDASVMHGPTHRAGSVASLRNIRNHAAVALCVLRYTDHVMLVGEGALRFARRMGFTEQDLLTEQSRAAWEKWKADPNRARIDDWLEPEDYDGPPLPPGHTHPAGARSDAPASAAAATPIEGDQRPAEAPAIVPASDAGDDPRARYLASRGIPWTHGTIHCSALNAAGALAACTSTSGLAWKIPGRVGDSPIVGAGMFCDNDIGAAGATGRGEAAIQTCCAHSIVELMARGMTPTEACLEALRRIARATRSRRLLDAHGRPNFGFNCYALRRDGAYGSAAFTHGARFAVHDGRENRLLECAALYP